MISSIPCLLDTNSIIKYYHDVEDGAEIIAYLFDKSPSAQINIIDLQVPEVASVFHKLHKKGVITEDGRDKSIDTFLSDVRDKKIMRYVFKERHLSKLFENLYVSYTVPPPIRKQWEYIPFINGYSKLLKELADTNDVAMLTIMQEIQDIVEESYLFTSDGHVLEIAKEMKLNVLNPEKMTFKDIPVALDVRCEVRRKISTKAICHSSQGISLGSRKAVDISTNGACLLLDKDIPRGEIIKIEFRKNIDKCEVESEVMWSTKNKIGVRFVNSGVVIPSFLN